MFLDFDGPIIPALSHAPITRPLESKAWPACIRALNRITDTTAAKIVVSSTWRWSGVEHVTRLLQSWGATAEVIGVTPILTATTDSGLAIEVERGREIGDWLLAHPEVDSFVIIDDDDDMGVFRNKLVQTPFATGLTERSADRAIQILLYTRQERYV